MASSIGPNAKPLLQSLEEDCKRQSELVEHIRGLLARADERRAAEPQNARKWNKVLDNLEAALDEAKAKLEHCERRLEDERRRYDGVPGGNAFPDPTRQAAAPAAAPVDEGGGSPAEAAAAQFLLSTPLETVESVPLEQVALAQNYLAWRNDAGHSDGEDRRLAGRIELAIQGGNPTPPPSPSDSERRRQQALRVVVDKIAAGAVDSLTLREVDLAAACYAVLCRKPDADLSERRLKELLHRALLEVEQVLTNMRRKMDALSTGT